MKRTESGLTVLELMVVLGTVAILLGVGLPAFASTLERVRAATVFNEITASLAFARSTAVTQRQSVSVCPSSEGLRCRTDGNWDDGWIVFLDPAHVGQPAEAKAVIRRGERPGGQLAVRATSGRPLVRFQRAGSAYGSNVTLRLCRAGRLLGAIVVNNSGRARTARERSPPPCPFSLD